MKSKHAKHAKSILKVYVTNLAKYNEGKLIGEWLELPATEEDVDALLDRIGIDEHCEEIFLADYESDYGIKCDEYDNLQELNKLAEELNNLDEQDLEIVKVLITEGGYHAKTAIYKVTGNEVEIYPDCYTMTDVAIQYCNDYEVLRDVPHELQHYFDYEAFARDLEVEGEFYYHDGNYYEVR